MKPESWFPPALFLAGLGALGYGLVTESGVRRVVIALYLAWTVTELRVTFRRSPGEAGGDDRGSMPLYGLARGAVVAAAVFAPAGSGWPGWPSGRIVPLLIVVFLAGIALRLTAVVHLGRFYSHRVRTLHDHAIVSTGPYRFIRHPAYAGMIVAHAGFVAIFANPYIIAACAGLLIPAIVHRILVEERTLMELTGYPAYARNRKRLVPVVW
ncbi:isoprenylcysteine carboxylmethyltransferase family protein [Streptomyces sp. RB6PN25]|uniref:Isoprenylcysteine carboxylmethyltransferase family protein n=1 Tax=Streptomyces humicola TaxID=2953240 RepID=A0ABT1PU25_9ACTN|nr:isoprenylcysteine carboxylmethyltransferase family protein [Streptomyces humicola]